MPVSEIGIRELVARRLREERKARGVTQAQLAEALGRNGLSITESDVRKREKGLVSVKAEELVAFAHVLGVPLVELLAPAEGDESAVRVGNGWLIFKFPNMELRGWGTLAYDRHGMRAWLRTGSASGEMLQHHLQPLDDRIAARARAFGAATTEDAKKQALADMASAARLRERERAEPPWTRSRRR